VSKAVCFLCLTSVTKAEVILLRFKKNKQKTNPVPPKAITRVFQVSRLPHSQGIFKYILGGVIIYFPGDR